MDVLAKVDSLPGAFRRTQMELPEDICKTLDIIADGRRYIVILSMNVFKVQCHSLARHVFGAETTLGKGSPYPRHGGFLLLVKNDNDSAWTLWGFADIEFPASDLTLDAFAVPLTEAFVSDWTRSKMKLHQSKYDPLMHVELSSGNVSDAKRILADTETAYPRLMGRCRNKIDVEDGDALTLLRKMAMSLKRPASVSHAEWNRYISLYHNDPYVKERCSASVGAIELLVDIFPSCKVIVKSSTAIDAIRNYCARNIRRTVPAFTSNVLDVAMFNDASRLLCGSAKLADTYSASVKEGDVFLDIARFIPHDDPNHPLSKALMIFCVACRIGRALYREVYDSEYEVIRTHETVMNI